MQDELIKDMLEKEAELRYCLFGANFGILLLGFSVPVILVLGGG
ncbi:hypothetical protein [Rubellimicrobium roseum]|nr:hypothetical protein [Rubellimicrobium roseum]